MVKISGCGTALITPFDATGAIDYSALAKLLHQQADQGINFLVILGSTAETACLTATEKQEIVKFVTKEIQLPIFIGVGSNCTAAVLENIKCYEEMEINGYLVVTPYYNKPTQAGLYAHFATIAEHTTKNILLYNVPGRTGINLTAETTLKLAEIPNIIGIKEASSRLEQINQIISAAPRDFAILSGNDSETLPLMALGAHGVVSVASNIAPRQCVALTTAMLRHDLVTAQRLQKQLLPLFINCFVETNPIPVKAGLAILGKINNNLRLPLTSATDETIQIMRKTLEQLGL